MRERRFRMRIIRNSYIPFRGFTAMNLLGVLFVRREAAELTPETLNHEKSIPLRCERCFTSLSISGIYWSGF